MKKSFLLMLLLGLLINGINAQTADQISPETQETRRLDATIICLDALEAPTKYNAFAQQFTSLSSFPKKTANQTTLELRKAINAWFLANTVVIKKVLIERKKAHDLLYGPRPY